MTTREVIDAYYATSAKGDWDGWLALFRPDLVMIDVLGGRIDGTKALRSHVDDIKGGYSKFLMQPVHVFVDGNTGGVFWHFQGANRAGVPIDATGSNFFVVEDGKIAHIEEFFNPAPFAPFVNQKLK